MKVKDPFEDRLATLEEIARCARSLAAINYLPQRDSLRATLIMALEDLARIEGGPVAPVVTEANYRERERLRRRIARWVLRIDSLPFPERKAILGRILARYFTGPKRGAVTRLR
jgi:hypothetical protein